MGAGCWALPEKAKARKKPLPMPTKESGKLLGTNNISGGISDRISCIMVNNYHNFTFHRRHRLPKHIYQWQDVIAAQPHREPRVVKITEHVERAIAIK